ncbi:MAG: hypothetical protein QM530_06890 [Phycisphaerales bacterium]|nr:hypothetical protein [Phycisphaerales bacterium]
MRTNRFYTILHFKPFCTALLALGLLLTVACNKTKTPGNSTPAINFTGISSDSIQAGSSAAIRLSFNFSDGDGNLGNKPSSGIYDIYTIDSRDNSFINYYFPQELPSVVDPTKELTGTCQLDFRGEFILLRPTRPGGDTVRYEVYIRDREGNESNHFTTPNIYIKP